MKTPFSEGILRNSPPPFINSDDELSPSHDAAASPNLRVLPRISREQRAAWGAQKGKRWQQFTEPARMTPRSSATAFESDVLTTARLERLAEDWLTDCQVRMHSTRTIEDRRSKIECLLWFLHEYSLDECGHTEMKRFFAYLATSHTHPQGRWGKGQGKQWTTEMKGSSIATFYTRLSAFFNWLVAEDYLSVSPLMRIRNAWQPSPQIVPFTSDQVKSLLDAARRSANPLRDEAIVRLLHDSGLRASELCNLKLSDIDFDGPRVRVLGKGRKWRTVMFGRRTARAIWTYLSAEPHADDDYLFWSEQGMNEPLTRNGLHQLCERLGTRAGVRGVRCSPHTFRHTFAVDFLRNGGHAFALKELLGHTSMAITNRYVNLAQTDVAAQYRQASPGDRL